MATSTETAYLYGGVLFVVAFVALGLIKKYNTGSGEIGLILFCTTLVLIALYVLLKSM